MLQRVLHDRHISVFGNQKPVHRDMFVEQNHGLESPRLFWEMVRLVSP
jgi:hypothetical protein